MGRGTSLFIATGILLVLFFSLCFAGQTDQSATEPNEPVVRESADQPSLGPVGPSPDGENSRRRKERPLEPSDAAIRTAKAELQAEFYKEALESYRREMDNYKWVFKYSLEALGIIVALAGVFVGYLTYLSTKSARRSKSAAEESTSAAKESKLGELWSKASLAYNTGDYETATKIWESIYKDYKIQTRPFFNNWGSSLLNWARQLDKGDPRKKELLKEAIEKYKKAESFRRGIAAYNIACAYGLLDEEQECEKWLKIGEDSGMLLTRQRAESDEDLRKFRDESWFKEIRFRGE